MATITLASSFCSGNNHVHIVASGAKSGAMDFEATELRNYQPSAEDLWAAARTLLALGAVGKTPAQARTWLLAGVTITITP
jgi:hypothetical protein